MSSQLQKDAAAEGSISRTLYKQLFIRPSPFPPGLRLDGKTAIVTGANSGLGFEAARQLLSKGLSHLIVAVRSEEKGEAAIQSLRYEFPDANIALSLLDLDDYESIIAFVSRCGGVGQVDYIILNAGVQRRVFERNQKTGHETVLQINFLSTALLAMMLASQLKKRTATRASGNPPVLTVVGSDTMYFSKLNTSCPILSLMDEPSRFAGFQQYMDTKLMLMMFVALLAERYRSEDIVINVCNPGMTYGTNLGRDSRNSGVARYIIWPFVRALGRPLHIGASVYIHALLIENRESHGSFVSDWAIRPYAAPMYTSEGRDMMNRLWRETMDEFRKILASDFHVWIDPTVE